MSAWNEMGVLSGRDHRNYLQKIKARQRRAKAGPPRKPGRQRVLTDEERDARRKAHRQNWIAKHPDRNAQSKRNWVEKNPGYRTQQMRDWRAQLTEEKKARINARNQAYRAKNPEKVREWNRAYRARHRERINVARRKPKPTECQNL